MAKMSSKGQSRLLTDAYKTTGSTMHGTFCYIRDHNARTSNYVHHLKVKGKLVQTAYQFSDVIKDCSVRETDHKTYLYTVVI